MDFLIAIVIFGFFCLLAYTFIEKVASLSSVDLFKLPASLIFGILTAALLVCGYLSYYVHGKIISHINHDNKVVLLVTYKTPLKHSV